MAASACLLDAGIYHMENHCFRPGVAGRDNLVCCVVASAKPTLVIGFASLC